MRDKTQEISLEVSFFNACRSDMTPSSLDFGTRMANSVHELIPWVPETFLARFPVSERVFRPVARVFFWGGGVGEVRSNE